MLQQFSVSKLCLKILRKIMPPGLLAGVLLGVSGETPDEKLINCIPKAETENIRQSLKDGANPNLADANGNTVLMMACLFGQNESVKLLLDSGADVNLQAQNGNTALIIASSNNRIEIIKLLLGKNPDINIKNKKGNDALNIALAKGFLEAAKLILKNTSAVNITQQTLYAASRTRNPELLKLLKEKSPDSKISEEIDKRIDAIEQRIPKPASSREMIFLLSLFAFAAIITGFFIYKKQGFPITKKKALLWTGGSLGTFIVLAGIVYIFLCTMWNLQLKLALSSWEKSEKALKSKQLIPAPLPDSENAAVELKEAFLLISEQGRPYAPNNYRGQMNRELFKVIRQFSTNIYTGTSKEIMSKISSPQQKATKDILYSDHMNEVFSLMEKASKKSGLNFNLKFDKRGPLPHLEFLSCALNLWINKACLEAAGGNYETAFNILFAALKISELQEKEPTLSSYFSGITTVANIAVCTAAMTKEYPVPDASAMKFMNELQNINFVKWQQNAYAFEITTATIPLFDSIVSNKNTDERFKRFITSRKTETAISSRLPMDKRDFACYLNTWAEIDESYSLPSWKKIEKIKELTGNIPKSCVISRLFLGNVPEMFSRDAYLMDEIAVCKLTLALRIYNNRKGKYPDTLDELQPDILQEIPLDYLTGKPFIYKHEGNSFSLSAEGIENFRKKTDRNRNRNRQ